MTDTNRQELKDFADAVIAHINGKQFEWKTRTDSGDMWMSSNPKKDYAFDFDTNLYRPKPEPITRPWSKPEHVPDNCWIRRADMPLQMKVGAIFGAGVAVHDCSRPMKVAWSELEGYEYSIDRKNWQPCTITEP